MSKFVHGDLVKIGNRAMSEMFGDVDPKYFENEARVSGFSGEKDCLLIIDGERVWVGEDYLTFIPKFGIGRWVTPMEGTFYGHRFTVVGTEYNNAKLNYVGFDQSVKESGVWDGIWFHENDLESWVDWKPRFEVGDEVVFRGHITTILGKTLGTRSYVVRVDGVAIDAPEYDLVEFFPDSSEDGDGEFLASWDKLSRAYSLLGNSEDSEGMNSLKIVFDIAKNIKD